MKIRIYQVDAFTDKVFSGNPAAVCPLDNWLDDSILQNIAAENNLAETAFYVRGKEHLEIRWFTPKVEVDLCGHATLAAAFVLFNYEDHDSDLINFYSHRSGMLTVTRNEDLLTLNFPTDDIHQIELPAEVKNAFNFTPLECHKGNTDYMIIFNNETEIRDLSPDLTSLKKLDARGVIVTAKGDNVDFVSRFFAPQVGIDEDPVTGSAHTSLTPYWSEKLKKNELTAIQLSARKGYLQCKNLKERVDISGKAKLYLRGEIFID
jgi:PhzF family phenazine biosynthesis protein